MRCSRIRNAANEIIFPSSPLMVLRRCRADTHSISPSLSKSRSLLSFSMLHAIAPASRMMPSISFATRFSLPSSSCPPSLFLRPHHLNHHRHYYHKLKLRSSLRDSKKATLRKASPNLPNNLKSNRAQKTPDKDDNQSDNGMAVKGTLLAGLLLVGVIGGFGGVGYVYRDQINSFLTQFSEYIDGYGPAGYAIFVLVYAGLEIFAIPAIPLTMSAGLLFGNVTGTVIVSISGTVAAAVAFLIARYFARERILKLVEGNKKFIAIDRAIGENGFKVVTLLRLSPLLPFSLGNYLYGLTSVKFLPYILGSWLGMLPGSWAYVSAGAFGRAIIQEESEVGLPGGNGQLVTLGIGLLFTAIAAAYVANLAKDAVKDIDE